MSNDAPQSVRRLGPGKYVLAIDSGVEVPISIADSDFIHLVRALGYAQWYDLEAHLEVVDDYVGIVLLSGVKPISLEQQTRTY